MRLWIVGCLSIGLLSACNLPDPLSQILSQGSGEERIPSSQEFLTPGATATPGIFLPVSGTPTTSTIQAPLIPSPRVISIHMFDENHGWVFTEFQVARTFDGGVSWYDVTPADVKRDLFGVSSEFTDALHAWILIPELPDYQAGTLFRTSDGGQHWSSSTTPFGGGDLEFVDANIGWMMSDLGIGAGSMAVSVFQTTDGGATWTRTYTNDSSLEGAGESLPRSGIKNQITPLNSQTAWISGIIYSPGTIYLYRTDDGGRVWFKIDLVLPKGAEQSDFLVDQMGFLSARTGMLALRVGGDQIQTYIYVTEDGGNSWSQSGSPISGSGQIEFLSATDYIVEGLDQLFVTRDTGLVWTSISSEISFGYNVVELEFVNPTTGWVINTDSAGLRKLYKTSDGGWSWVLLTP
ncbi:MAG: hypothetical protein FJZ87_13550 [Chloroflexi bacterium]|nr:hypothetical protein [Chloroflexota bacterium]